MDANSAAMRAPEVVMGDLLSSSKGLILSELAERLAYHRARALLPELADIEAGLASEVAHLEGALADAELVVPQKEARLQAALQKQATDKDSAARVLRRGVDVAGRELKTAQIDVNVYESGLATKRKYHAQCQRVISHIEGLERPKTPSLSLVLK